MQISDCAATVNPEEQFKTSPIPPKALTPSRDTIMNLEQSKALQQFGITLKESQRYNTVSTLFGRPLAERELQHNLKSYEREFLKDEAVSLPHTYYHLHGELYSQSTDNPLFNVKKQIDARERNGATLEGFGKFEGIIAQAQPDMVSVWYSPEGPSGFEGVNFDSGRLYFNFKTGENDSTNFDIKVRPEFPILPLLGTLHKETEGSRPGFDSPETGKMYYLTHPIATGMQTNEFFSFMEAYAAEEPAPLYVSRRDGPDVATRTLSSTVSEMKELFAKHSAGEAMFAYDPEGDKTAGAQMRQEDLMRRYMSVIAPYVEAGNGTVTLYGCSTTSTVSRNDIQSVIASHSVEGLVSLHATAHRLLTNKLPPGTEVKKDRYDDYKCPHCDASIRGELKDNPDSWTKQCPSCHQNIKGCAN